MRISRPQLVQPRYKVTQLEAQEAIRTMFREMPNLQRYITICENAGVETRHLVRPLDWYAAPHPFTERNHIYQEEGLSMAGQAIDQLAEFFSPDVEPATTVRNFCFTSTTGLATPSLDALLLNRTEMPLDLRRIPISGLGCAGAAGALSIASKLTEPTLVLSVEICSLSFRPAEMTPLSIVGAALFGDGAAACVVSPDAQGPEIIASYATILPDAEDAMGWEYDSEGMKLVLSPRIPDLVIENLQSIAADFLAANSLNLSDVDHFIIHPGGSRVMEAAEEALGLNETDTAPSRNFLHSHGNLSSASILFILAKIDAKAGDTGIIIAFGPGFAVELLLLRW